MKIGNDERIRFLSDGSCMSFCSFFLVVATAFPPDGGDLGERGLKGENLGRDGPGSSDFKRRSMSTRSHTLIA